MPPEDQVPIYLIGITGRYRGEPLEAQLRDAGLRFERIEGVTTEYEGRPSVDFYDAAQAEAVIGRGLLPGEIGCALAHRVARQAFLRTRRPWALVLEDDARIQDAARLRMLLDAVERQRGGRPEIIELYARGAIAWAEPHDHWQALAREPRTTTAYLVNRAAARWLVARELPLVSPADWPLRGSWRIRFSAAFPWTVAPDEADGSLIADQPASTALAKGRTTVILGRPSRRWWWAHRRNYDRRAGWDPVAMRRSYRAWWVREREYRQISVLAGRPPYLLPADAIALPTLARSAASRAALDRATATGSKRR